MWLTEIPAATVANMKHMHGIASDGEKDAVCVGSFPIEKLAHFKREAGILGHQRTAFREVGKRCDRFIHRHKPAETCVSSVLRQQPFKN